MIAAQALQKERIRRPSDNCIRFRFAVTGAIYKWEFTVDERLVQYDVKENLTISDAVFRLDAGSREPDTTQLGAWVCHLFVVAGSAIHYVAIQHCVL